MVQGGMWYGKKRSYLQKRKTKKGEKERESCGEGEAKMGKGGYDIIS